MRLPLAANPAAFLRALPVSLGMLVLTYTWAIRSDAAFEEASAVQAEARADQKTGPRRAPQQAGAAPFTLGLEGPPEFAILWKNLIMVGRYASLRMLLRIAPLIVFFVVFLRGREGAVVSSTIAMILLGLAFYTTLVGPQLASNDLRRDLGNLPVLKTWPISGVALLRGEILAPALLLTVVAWLFLLPGALLVRNLPAAVMKQRVAFTVAAMAVAPGLLLVQLVLQNAIAVIFPAWMNTSPGRPRGIDAMGQRIQPLRQG